MKVMWYAVNRLDETSAAIIQFDPSINGWITLSHHHPDVAEKEVALRNDRLRQTYAANGWILK